MKKSIIILVIISALLVTIWVLINNKAKVNAKVYNRDPNEKILVTSTKVTRQNLFEDKKYIGTVTASRDNRIASETSGKVIYVGVKEGDVIGTGHVIAKVDDTMLQLQLEAAEVQLESIMLDVKRYENLTKGDAIPAVQLEKTNIQRRSSEIQIKTLKEQIARTTIVSPYSGVVSAKSFDLGTVLGPGVPLLQLTDIGNLKLNLKIPEKEITRFKMGMHTEITCDVYPGATYDGVVTMIGEKGDEAHNFPAELTIRNTKVNPMRPGMFGSVQIGNTVSQSSIAIPVIALIGTIKEPQVYKIENGKAYLKNLTIGITTNEYLEVVSGLNEGDEIVTVGQVNLYDGAPISVNINK